MDSESLPLKCKGSNPVELSLSMDLLMADRLGPVMLNLRDEAVTKLSELMPVCCNWGTKPILKVTNLRAVALVKTNSSFDPFWGSRGGGRG